MIALIWDLVGLLIAIAFLLFMAWVLKIVWRNTFGKKSTKNNRHGIE